MPKTVELCGNQLVVDGHPVHLRGAEIHYFRLDPETWAARVADAAEAGMNCVSTYMPWYHHERVEGAVDLTGRQDPQCDLRGFMRLVADAGLWLIARPGPFVNSELRCGGIPEWLFRDHPRTHSRAADDRPRGGRPAAAEGEPLYRHYVRTWYRAVNAVIAPFDAGRGGPVILYQPDNELSACWTYGLLNSLYDPVVLGEYWPRWLERHYDLGELNERYAGEYRAFAEIEPPRAFPTTAAERARCRDWMTFKRWFFADWGATLAGWAREDGITVPMMFNEPVAGYYGHGDHPGFGAVLRARGETGFTACHTYSAPILDLDGIVGASLGVEITKASPWGGPPVTAEANAAWFIPRLARSQVNWPVLLRLGSGRGLQGYVIYPFVAGDVTFEDVIDGPEYWPQTCVTVDGRRQDGFDQLAAYNDFLAAWEAPLSAADNVVDATIAFTPGQRLLDFLGAPELFGDSRQAGPGGEAFDAEPSLDRGGGGPSHEWLDGVEGVTKQVVPPEAGVWKRLTEALVVANRLNVQTAMRELTNPNRQPGEGCLIVPNAGALEAVAISYLCDHLDAGGRALFFPTVPRFDLAGRPDERLTQRLGLKLHDGVRPAGGKRLDYGTRVVEFAGDRRCGVEGWILRHQFPANAKPLAVHEHAVVAATVGQAVVCGCDMRFTSFGTLELWRWLLAAAGVVPAVEVADNWLHALWRRGPGGDFLAVLNLSGATGPSQVVLRDGEAEVARFDLELAPHEGRLLVVDAPLGDWGRLRYSSSEATPLDPERRRWRLRGAAGTPGVMAFDQAVRGRLDGQPVVSTPGPNGHLIRYEHRRQPLVLTLGED